MQLTQKHLKTTTYPNSRFLSFFGHTLAMTLLVILLASCTSQDSPTVTPVGVSSSTIRLSTGIFPRARFSPDGKILAVAGLDGVWLVDPTDLAKQPMLINDRSGVRSPAFAPNGKALAYGDEDGTVHILPLQASAVLSTSFRAFNYEVETIAFSPDGKLLAVGGITDASDQPVELWTVDQLNLGPKNLLGHQGKVLSVAFSPDGQLLASGSTDGDIDIWSVVQTQTSGIVLKGAGRATEVAFSPKGDVLASAGEDGRVQVWDVHTLSPLATPTVLSNQPGITPLTINTERAATSLAFSPDGQRLAVGYASRIIQVFNMSNLTQAPTVLHGNFRDLVYSVTFSPDGQLLVGAGTGILQIWNVDTFPAATP